MDQKEQHSLTDRLKILSGRLLMLVTLFVNIITTIGVIWVALKIGLYRDPQRRSIDISEGTNGYELFLNEGIQADTLIVDDKLGVESIVHEQISIVGQANSKSPQPEISINQDYISMQAKSFGLDDSLDNQFQFKIDRELDSLDISHDAYNVRSIRADGVPTSSNDLSFESTEELELSGNLGATIHSRDIVLKSKKGITISSGENVIDIRSAGGLFIPNIQFASQSEDMELNELDTSDKRLQLCIRKSDGSLFRAQLNDC